MGARGSLKIAAHLKAVPDAIAGTAAAQVAAVAPVMPQAVADSEELRALWEQIVPSLDEAGLIAAADGPAVEMALRHYRAARAASDDLAAGSSTTYDAKNQRDMKNPAEVVFRSESMAFLEYAKQLGMTFVSRARTPAAKGADDDGGNPFRGAVNA